MPSEKGMAIAIPHMYQVQLLYQKIVNVCAHVGILSLLNQWGVLCSVMIHAVVKKIRWNHYQFLLILILHMTVVVHRRDLIQIMKKDKPMNLPFAHLPCQTITINHRAMLMVNIPMPTGKSDKGEKISYA